MNKKINLNTIIVMMVVVLPVMALMTTPYFKLSILIPILVVIGVISLAKRQDINVFFYIIIFLIPFGEYRKIGPLNIPWLLAMLVLAVAALDIVQGKLSIKALKGKIWYYLFPMLFVNLIATGLSPYPETAIDAMKNWLAAYLFIALMLLLITERGVFKDLPFWIVVSVSLGSALSVMGVYLGIGYDLFTDEGRGQGGAPDPNNMCMMIIFVIPLVVHYLLYAETFIARIGATFLLLLNLLAVLSTDSRSGMLVAALIFGLLIIIHIARIKARYIRLILPVILIGLLALPMVIPQKTLIRMQTLTASYQDKSVQRRGAYIDVGIRAFMEQPIIGYGPFTFQHIFAESRESRKFKREGVRGEELRQAHNTYLEMLVGSGILGLGLFLGVILQAQLNLHRARKGLAKINSAEYSHLILSFQVAFLGALIYLAVFSDPYHKFLLVMLPLSELALRYTHRLQANFNQQTQAD